jgi:hypothetical protein
MPIQIQGNTGVAAEVDGTTFRALRTTERAPDYGAFGIYQVATTVPLVVTQAANGTLFSVRWGDATRLMVPMYLSLTVQQTAAATATIFPRFQAFVARSFTVSDSAGTAITITGNNMKKRTSMGTTLVTDMRVSAVAAGLTVGTRTLDAQPFLELPGPQTITNPLTASAFAAADYTNGQDMPIVLAQNEGLIVRGPTTVFGAAGTADLSVRLAWAELASY